MTQQQKEQISKLRATDTSYSRIASVLGLSVNTVKSYCQRNPTIIKESPAPVLFPYLGQCPQCGTKLEQTPGHRQKRFCSPKCRTTWWSSHPEQMKRRKLTNAECQHCGTVFFQYGSRPRKFCSRGCYLAHWYGQGGDTHG